MSFMDTGDGPSSSYSSRGGGRAWGGRNNYNRGGRSYSQNRGGYNDYEQDQQYQGGRGRNSNRGYNNGPSWNSRGGGGGYRGRNSNYWGNTTARGAGRYQSRGRGGSSRGWEYDDPVDVAYVTILRGHTDGVTAMVVDQTSGQLFTGAKDGTVRLWDLQKRQCLKVVEVGGQVDSMLMESGILFVGLHKLGDGSLQSLPGCVKVYNLQGGSEHALTGHQGPVYSLAAANNMLFSGGHDHSIRVWQFNQPTGLFEAAAVLTSAQGGHSMAVKTLQVINNYLFSGDFQGVIKVWDMSLGQCVQSIQQAHSGAVMSLLAWEGYLLSGSVDGTIRIWQPSENPGPGAVLDPQPAYSHPPTSSPNDEQEIYGKTLTLAGTTDCTGKSVLLASYSLDNVVRLWQLPEFTDRGHLNAIKNCVSIQSCQNLIVAGDYMHGQVKVWQWKNAS